MASGGSELLKRIAVLLLLWVGLACGGGGGGGGSNNPPTNPGPTVVFLPAGSGLPQSIEFDSGSSSGARLTVVLEVEQVSDLYGVSLDVTYPSSFMNYVSALEGDHLRAGGLVSTSLQVVEEPAGNLVVGLSRLGDVAGAGGSGRLLSLTFDATTSGEGQLRIVGPSAFGSTGEEIDGLTWNGGTVRASF